MLLKVRYRNVGTFFVFQYKKKKQNISPEYDDETATKGSQAAAAAVE